MDKVIVYSNQRYNECKALLSDYIMFFTPTYNRANFLSRVHDCLLSQTDKRFIWCVVNDGSSDNTNVVVRELMDKELCPIIYVNKPNGGKHSAFEEAMKVCKTGYFMCMDDDDLYSPDSVSFYLKKWKEVYEKYQQQNIGSIRTIAKRANGSFAASFEVLKGCEYVDTTLNVFWKKNRIQENWTCYEVEKLKSIDLFSKDYWMSNKHHFFLESIWQGRFARKYNSLFVNIALREYTDDAAVSIIRSPKNKQKIIDTFINQRMIIEEQSDYLGLIRVMKYSLLVSILRIRLGLTLFDLINHTEKGTQKCIYILLSPIAFFMSLVYKKY